MFKQITAIVSTIIVLVGLSFVIDMNFNSYITVSIVSYIFSLTSLNSFVANDDYFWYDYFQ